MRKFVVGGCIAAALVVAVTPQPLLAAPQARVEAAVKSSAKSDRHLKAFYRARGYRPLWVRGGSLGSEADRLIALVATAHLDGLDPEDYRPRRLFETVEKARSRSPKALGRAEALLSRTLAAYVADLRRPVEVGMTYVDPELAPTPPGPRAVLEAAASAPSLDLYLSEMRWMNPIYARLREALAAHRHRGGGMAHYPMPAGPLMRPGAAGERVRMLRARLGLPAGDRYDPALAAAVRDFQAIHGLPDDGVVGPMTLAALNRRPEDQGALLRINLQRARALPPAFGGRYVLVDAAAARLFLYEGGRVVDTMKVIVGKPGEQTPMMAAYIRYATLNPYWKLPPDLVRLRIVPNVLEHGPSWLRRAGYEVASDWSDDAHAVDPARVDWEAVAAGRLDVPVRQLPGRDNAMGRMKFMLPNHLGIYLHDTPDKHLFDEPGRRFSSGCVRVEDAPRLARWLFGGVPKARSDAPEQQVMLPRPVPVYITYLTAMPTDRGIAFRSDPYGRDGAQLARLGSRAYAGR